MMKSHTFNDKSYSMISLLTGAHSMLYHSLIFTALRPLRRVLYLCQG